MLKYDKFMRRGKKKAQEIEIEMRITSQHSVSWSSRNRREKISKKERNVTVKPIGENGVLEFEEVGQDFGNNLEVGFGLKLDELKRISARN